MNIIDISPEISEETAVWPGDTSYKREVLMDVNQGDSFGLSKITSTLHLGAHTDAPNHYGVGEGISQRSLNYYFGPCQVVSVSIPGGESVIINNLPEIKAPRVLFKTKSFPDPKNWNNDFCSLSPELIDYLAQKNVLLVGIDTPSIDPFWSKDLKAHSRIEKYNMAILEGIVLDEVKEGLYTLSALPLKLRGADASPVRAILIDDLTSQTGPV